jgi:hypothetical protein
MLLLVLFLLPGLLLLASMVCNLWAWFIFWALRSVFSSSSIFIDKLCCRGVMSVRVSRFATTSRMMGRANCSIGPSS